MKTRFTCGYQSSHANWSIDITHPFVRALLSTLAMAAACTTQPSEPGAGSGDVVYVVGESASLFVVDPRAGRVLAEPSAPPELKLTPVLSNDSSTLFFTMYDSTSAIYSLTAPGFALQRLLDLTPPQCSSWFAVDQRLRARDRAGPQWAVRLRGSRPRVPVYPATCHAALVSSSASRRSKEAMASRDLQIDRAPSGSRRAQWWTRRR